ncbi:MAG TPA: hypothetical protein VMF65_14645 [Acidimicrobiales bacterium]|nr:hypothetical protein [Acidimicrobiales bacterium]
MPGRAPLAVLVGGAPGSGKTTLAGTLSIFLDLPVLHKDQLVHGRWRTLSCAVELGEAGVEPFFQSMELWAGAGISFVADQTFYPGVSERDITSRLAPLTTLVQVHCFSADSLDRWEQRMRGGPLCGEARLNKLMPVVKRLTAELAKPLHLECPTFVVDTDEGYRPALEQLVADIDAIYSRPKIHELDR